MSKKLQHSIQLLLIIFILIVVNLLSSGFFKRFDLTKEKRYSLSDVSIESMDSLDNLVYVKVYLEGDFPPQIRKFQDAIETTLAELKQYAGSNMEYDFIDPSKSKELRELFVQKGITPIPVRQASETEASEKYMYPVMSLTYQNRELYIDLLKGAAFPNGEVNFLKAEQNLEYRIVSSIRNISRAERPVVAVLKGHGEYDLNEVGEFITELQQSYEVYTFDMKNSPGQAISPSIKALLVLQPTEAFSERDKYEIDQYLMRGGNVMWMMNNQKVDMDMFNKRSCVTELRELNLDDMFMTYGFKLNYDLAQDRVAEKIEVVRETPSGAKFEAKRWPFYPILYEFPEHPITRNLDAALLRYPSTIDTIPQAGVRYRAFMTTSPYSRTVQGSQFIDIAQYLSAPPPSSLFNKGRQIIGLSAEGEFNSVFVGRQAPTDSLATKPPTAPFGARSGLPGRIVVLSDGEFVLGNLFRGERRFMPYDNKALLVNAVDYLAGEEAMTGIRAKDLVVRKLDVGKIQGETSLFGFIPMDKSTRIQVINLGLPILIIVLFGVIRAFVRRRKHAGKQLGK